MLNFPKKTKTGTSFALLLATAALLSGCASSSMEEKDISSMPAVQAADVASYPVKEPLSALERAYKKNSKDPSIAAAYAEGLRENDQYGQANMILNAFLSGKHAEHPEILAEFAALQAALGSYEEAELYARKAIAQDDSTGKAFHVLGVALDARGHHQQAETALRQALELWKGNPANLLNNLGLNLAAQGFIDPALEALRKAQAISPHRREIERNIRIVEALRLRPPERARASDEKEKVAPVPEIAPLPASKPETLSADE